MEALYGGSSSKKARNEYNNDESNLQGSSLASFLIKVENNEEEDFHQSNQNVLANVVHPLHKLASELNDVDVHVLLTRFKDNPVIFKRARDEAYNVLYFQPEGDELRAEVTNYVECKICGKVFTKSGGHLKRHRSRHYPDIEAPTNVEVLPIQSTPPPVLPTFEMTRTFPQRSPILPVISPHELGFIQPQDRENLARVLTQFCIQERVTPDIFHRSSFVDLVNVLLSFGQRTQPSITATNILPPDELITTCIFRRFGWLCNEKVPRMQTDLLVYNGAFTVGCLSNLTAVSVHYFDKNWKLKQAVIGVAPCDDDLDSALIFNHCLESVSAINMQKQTLDQLICVSGTNTASWNELVELNNRHILCSCDLIERIVEETFDPKIKIEDLPSTGLNVIESVISAAKKLMKYAKFQIFESVKVPSETVYKWLKTIRVIEFANEQLSQMCLTSQNPDIQQTLSNDFFDVLQTLESNQLLAELMRFLKIFRLPIIELQMIEEATLPLVWPAVMTIKYDLNAFEKATTSPILKTLVSRAQHLIERDFSKLVNKEHKTATFLNPKQRKLQHLLKPEEYEQFKDDLRKRLNIEKPHVEQKVDERRRFYEDDDAENEQIDEIDLYLSTKRFGDQSIVAFWHANESAMPKLASEARRLLATPASSNYVSGNLARYVTKTSEFSVDLIAKLIITQTLELI